MQPYIPFDLSPLGNQAIDGTESKDFKWSFRDPSPTHLQGGYYIEYKENVSNAPINKTGWIESSNNYHTFPANTFTNGKTYAWRVKVKDNTTNTNLLTENQSTFEYSTDGWLAKNLYIGLTRDAFWDGAIGLKMSSSTNGNNHYAYIPYDITVTPLITYTFSAYLNIQNEITNGYVRISVIQKNSKGDVISETLGTNYALSTNGWVRAIQTITTLPDAKFVELRLCLSGVGIVYWDGVQFEKGSSATAFKLGSSVESPFSNWLTFKSIQKPTCSITYPFNDNDIVISSIPTISHSFSGTMQKNYQYKVYKEINMLKKSQVLFEPPINFSNYFESVNRPSPNSNYQVDSNVLWNGYPTLKVTTTSYDLNEGFACSVPSNAYVVGEKYTVSVYIKGNGNHKLMLWGNVPNSVWTNPIATFTLNNTWQRVSTTVTMPSTVCQYWGIRIDTNGTKQNTTYWVAGMQIERGDSATTFTVPDQESNLVWTSDVYTDDSNLCVMPKSLLVDKSNYKVSATVTDNYNLTNTSPKRVFYTNFAATSTNPTNFNVLANNDSSRMELSWSNVDTKSANYVGSGQRYKPCKFSGNGLEISDLGEKLYWNNISIPETFTLAGWFKPNHTPSKLTSNATFTRNTGAYSINYNSVTANTPRYEVSYFGNLLTDNQASVETSATDFVGNSTSVSRTTSAAESGISMYNGSACLLVQVSTNAQNLGTYILTPITIKPNMVYNFSAYGRLKTGAIELHARIEWKDASGTIISSVNGSEVTLDTTWKRMNISGAAPANAVKATLCVYSKAGNYYDTNVSFYLDGFQFEYGSIAKDFVLPSSGKAILLEEGTTNLFNPSLNTTDVEVLAGTETVYKLDATTNVSYEDFQTSGIYSVSETSPYTITFQAKWNLRLTYDFRCYNSAGTFIGNATYTKTIDPTPDPNNYQVYEIKITAFPAGTITCEMFRWFYTDLDNTSIAYLKTLQLEAKSFSTTYMTPGINRNYDVLSLPSKVINLAQGTIEIWVYVSEDLKDVSSNRYIFSHATSSISPYPNVIALSHTTSNSWYFWTGDSAGTISGCAVTDDLTIGWHHFACRWSSSEMALFIDGVKRATNTNVKLPSTSAANLYLGCWITQNYGSINTMIDDIRISNISKADSEIIAGYNSNKILGLDFYTNCKMYFTNGISYDYYNPQTKSILITYLEKDNDNWLKLAYDFLSGKFYVEKMVNGNLRLIGSPNVSLVIGQPFFYTLKQNTTTGITVQTGVNGVLTKWGD